MSLVFEVVFLIAVISWIKGGGMGGAGLLHAGVGGEPNVN